MDEKIIFKLGEKVKDPRKSGMITYSVDLILFITVAAVMSGAQTWNEIALFGASRKSWLQQFFPELTTTPSHDTFNRFFSILKPEVFETAFSQWVDEYFPKPRGVIAIDGKAMRGAAKHDPELKNSKDPSPVDVVTMWSKEYGISFGQLKVSEKSNEITAVPELIASMELSGCIVTIDAIGCQKKIADSILASKGDFLLACKRNQSYLRDIAQNIFDNQEENIAANPSLTDWYHCLVTENRGHGRLERREVVAMGQPGGGDYFEKNLNAPQHWMGINAFVKVRSTRTDMSSGETSVEERYYLTSLTADQVERIAQAIREHWSIENQLHWQLDVTFNEDDSCKIRNAAQNFSLICKICLSLFKRYKEVAKAKHSMVCLRKMAAWNDAFLMELLRQAIWEF